MSPGGRRLRRRPAWPSCRSRRRSRLPAISTETRVTAQPYVSFLCPRFGRRASFRSLRYAALMIASRRQTRSSALARVAPTTASASPHARARTPRREVALHAARAPLRSGGRRRSASTSSPSRSARAHRCGSSSRPWSAKSASCIGQNAPAAPRPRRRTPPARRAGAWTSPGSGGTRAATEPGSRRCVLERAEVALEVARRRSPAAPPPAPRTWSSGATRRDRCGAEVGQRGVEPVEDQVRAGQVARDGRPASSTARRRRARRSPARGSASRPARSRRRARGAVSPLGSKSDSISMRTPSFSRNARCDSVCVGGHAVQRRSLGRELVQHLVVDVELVGADRAERERVEDEDGRPAVQVVAA